MLDHHRHTYALPAYDSSEDVTDLWQERTDPENEFGQTCEAHYRHRVTTVRVGLSRGNWKAEHLPELVGLTITGGTSAEPWMLHLPREEALRNLGQAVVTDLEQTLIAKLENAA